MLLIGAASVKIWPDLLPSPLSDILFIGGLAVLGGLLFVPLIARMNLPFWPALSPYLRDLAAILKSLRRMFLILGLSFILQALGMGMVAVLGSGLEIDVPVAFYFAAVPIVSIAVLSLSV